MFPVPVYADLRENFGGTIHHRKMARARTATYIVAKTHRGKGQKINLLIHRWINGSVDAVEPACPRRSLCQTVRKQIRADTA